MTSFSGEYWRGTGELSSFWSDSVTWPTKRMKMRMIPELPSCATVVYSLLQLLLLLYSYSSHDCSDSEVNFPLVSSLFDYCCYCYCYCCYFYY